MAICKKQIIEVVHGDPIERYFKPCIDPALIANVYFDSDNAGLHFILPYSSDQQGYCLYIPSNITKHLRPVICTYDLTVELIDGNTLTVIESCPFTIFKKRNSNCECETCEDDASCESERSDNDVSNSEKEESDGTKQ